MSELAYTDVRGRLQAFGQRHKLLRSPAPSAYWLAQWPSCVLNGVRSRTARPIPWHGLHSG